MTLLVLKKCATPLPLSNKRAVLARSKPSVMVRQIYKTVVVRKVGSSIVRTRVVRKVGSSIVRTRVVGLGPRVVFAVCVCICSGQPVHVFRATLLFGLCETLCRPQCVYCQPLTSKHVCGTGRGGAVAMAPWWLWLLWQHAGGRRLAL